MTNNRRYFIALLPPQEVRDYANQIKQYFAEKYASSHAQKSPPHITLQPPFEWADTDVPLLEEHLTTFASNQNSIPISLNGYAAFVPRVIYIDVVRSLELLNLHQNLMSYLETHLTIIDRVGKTRPFAPHMTVAFKDLTRQNFKAAWSEFEKRHVHFDFTASVLTLLVHDGRRWNIKSEFPFMDSVEL